MARLKAFASGWSGVVIVAVTYVYFLIFAQFAFLNRLAQFGIADAHLKLVMAAMAFGGIALSLLSALKSSEDSGRRRLQFSFLICGGAAALTLLPLSLGGSIALALLIGAGVGLLTVTVVSNLRHWIGPGDGLFQVGLGTGIGYFICNLPALFTASPRNQATVAAVLCLLGVFVASKTGSSAIPRPLPPPQKAASFGAVLVAFTALVWLDSAAFFIIQSTPSLKAGTWAGSLHLWANGTIHLTAALSSAYLLRRRGLSFVLGMAVLALSIACVLLHEPGQIVLASLFYPAGVSLYSVALVAYPSLLAPSTSANDTARRAGLLYAVAGWFGSAMGIGMGQHLREVPLAFVAVAALLVLGPALFRLIRSRGRETGLVAAALTLAFCIHLAISASNGFASPPATLSAAERGRQVYISEGCINCHSQYVRPHTSDVLMWGPAETIEELRAQVPPLIGNRRQGPDLSQVGGRRSPLWLKAHFFSPTEVSHGSFMPSYAYLFEGSGRGEDLVLYLSGLKSTEYAKHVALEESWEPSAYAMSAASPKEGAHLYTAYCATCHEAAGATRLAWDSNFQRLPPDLRTGHWGHLNASEPRTERALRLAQIIKFGIPGTDMPGHEYLSDKDVSSIALWVNQSMAPRGQFASSQNHQE